MKEQLTGISLRFIEAVDCILSVHKEMKIEPSTAKSLSLIIGKDGNSISRIRQGMKDVSAEQVRRLATLCGLDINFFYNNEVKLVYNPELFNEDNYRKSIGGDTINIHFANQGGENFQLGTGDFSGTLYQGEVNQSSNHHYHFHQAEQIVSSFPTEYQGNISEELQKIKESYLLLEKELQFKNEELRKITDEFFLEVKSNKTELSRLIALLNEERQSKDEITKQYIKAISK